MKPLSVSQDIVPLGEFKARASTLLDQVAERRQALVITRNGRPAGVVMSPAEYDRLVERQRFLEDVAAGLANAEAGRVTELSEVEDWLAARRAGRRTDRGDREAG